MEELLITLKELERDAHQLSAAIKSFRRRLLPTTEEQQVKEDETLSKLLTSPIGYTEFVRGLMRELGIGNNKAKLLVRKYLQLGWVIREGYKSKDVRYSLKP